MQVQASFINFNLYKMKKYLKIILVCIAMIQADITWAQIDSRIVGTSSDITVIEYTYKDGTVPLAMPTDNNDNKETRISTWTEFGDGKFTTEIKPKHNFGNPDLPVRQHNTFVKATGIYTGGSLPPAHKLVKSGIVYTPNGSAETYKALMESGNYLHVTPNIYDVVTKDTMHFAVSYALPPNAQNKWALVFAYNNGGSSESPKAFEVLKSSDIKQPLFSDHIDDKITLVRNHQNNLTQIESGNAIYDEISNLVTKQYYQDLLAFDITNPAEFSDTVKNLFVTLFPGEIESVKSEASTNVSAFLINYSCGPAKVENPKCEIVTENGKPVTYQHDQDLALRGDKPHDPNYETVYPQCLELPKKSTDTLHYHIHCQNIGIGPAGKVRMATSLPYGVASGSINLHSLKYKIGNTKAQLPSQVRGYKFTAALNATHDSLIFIYKIDTSGLRVLAGTSETKSLSDVRTMADVWVDVPLNSSVASVLSSRTSIVFYDTTGVPELPVFTDEARANYKKTCSDCDCKKQRCKNKCKLWQWLFCKKC